MIACTFCFPGRRVPKRNSDVPGLRTRRSVRRCSRIIAVSEATRRDLTRLFNVPGEKITVIHNAIDERLTAASGEEEKKRILERYQVDAPFLLYTA